MTEIIGYQVVVDDKDAAKLQRFSRTAQTEMGKAEAAAKRSGGEIGRSMGAADRATAGLGTTMEKGRTAAFALAGGLSGMGAKAAVATTAISHLVMTGLNPLGIAIAAAAVSLGLLVSKHQEAAEAAKTQEAAIKDLLQTSRETQAGVRGILDPKGAQAQREAELKEEIRRLDSMARAARVDALQRAERERDITLRGMPFTVGNPAADAQRRRIAGLQGDDLLGEFGISDSSATFGIERGKVTEKLAQLQGSTLAEATKASKAAEEAARATYNLANALAAMPGERGTFGFKGGPGPLGDPFANGSMAARFGYRIPSSDATMAEIVKRYGGPGESDIAAEMEARFRVGGANPNARGPFTPAMPSGVVNEWRARGKEVGGAFSDGIGDTVSGALLGRGLDLKEFGANASELVVRGFIDALISQKAKAQMESAFASLFAQFGNIFGGGGAAANTGSGPSSDPKYSGLDGTTGGGGSTWEGFGDSGIRIEVYPEVEMVSEDGLRKSSQRAKREFFIAGSQAAGRRGGR